MAIYKYTCKICEGPSEEEICWKCNPDPAIDFWKLKEEGYDVKNKYKKCSSQLLPKLLNLEGDK